MFKMPFLSSTKTQFIALQLFYFSLSVVGGYFLSAELMAYLAIGLTILGMDNGEAVVFCSMLAFVVYLMLIIWFYMLRSGWFRLSCFFILPLALSVAHSLPLNF